MSLLSQLNLSAPAAPPARGPAPTAGAAPRPAVSLDDRTFERLRSFVYEEMGIYFQDNKRYLLESRVGRRLQALGLAGFDAYLAHLQTPAGQGELTALGNAVTINETFFFRNAAQLEIFEQSLLPELAERRMRDGSRRIRIWSAACSTGDEPYSFALLIQARLQRQYPQIRFELIGTDLNTEVLAVAQEGHFSDYAVRNVPPPLLRKHFRKQGERYLLSDEIKRMVQFRQANLVDKAAMRRQRGIDLILCANVLIYFDEASKRQVVSSLYGSLNPGGFLLVGFSETLYGVTQALQPVRFAKTIAYQKVLPAGLTEGVPRSSTAAGLAAPSPATPPAPSPATPPAAGDIGRSYTFGAPPAPRPLSANS